MRGLLSDLPTKNCWTIAEHVGNATVAVLHHDATRFSEETDTPHPWTQLDGSASTHPRIRCATGRHRSSLDVREGPRWG